MVYNIYTDVIERKHFIFGSGIPKKYSTNLQNTFAVESLIT